MCSKIFNAIFLQSSVVMAFLNLHSVEKPDSASSLLQDNCNALSFLKIAWSLQFS
jgi:hypothetical protein